MKLKLQPFPEQEDGMPLMITSTCEEREREGGGGEGGRGGGTCEVIAGVPRTCTCKGTYNYCSMYMYTQCEPKVI